MLGYRIVIQRRAAPSTFFSVTLPIISLLGGLAVGAIPVLLIGKNPLLAYETMLSASYGSRRDITDTLTEATPILLTALAAVVTFRINVWNIGAEGQLLIGAITSSGLAIALGSSLNGFAGLALVLLAGAAGGSLCAGAVALPHVRWSSDEIVLTLMMNFLALTLVNYLIYGSFSPWRDDGFSTFPRGKTLPDGFRLPSIDGRLDIGFIVALVVIVLVAWLLKHTIWGFAHALVGSSRAAASYAGVTQSKVVLVSFLASGAFSGLAGALLITGTVGALEPRSLAAGIGFTGILAAGLGRLSPLGIVPASILIASLVTSGTDLQRIGVPSPITVVLQGIILVAIAGGGFSLNYRLRLHSTQSRSAAARSKAVP